MTKLILLIYVLAVSLTALADGAPVLCEDATNQIRVIMIDSALVGTYFEIEKAGSPSSVYCIDGEKRSYWYKEVYTLAKGKIKEELDSSGTIYSCAITDSQDTYLLHEMNWGNNSYYLDNTRLSCRLDDDPGDD